MHTLHPDVERDMRDLATRFADVLAENELLNERLEDSVCRQADARDSIVALRQRVKLIRETQGRLEAQIVDMRRQHELDLARQEGRLAGTHETYQVMLSALTHSGPVAGQKASVE